MVGIGGIWVHLMHQFGEPKHFRADCNERVQTNILGPSMGYLGAFHARIWGAETFLGRLQRTCPNKYFRSYKHVRTRFAPFG